MDTRSDAGERRPRPGDTIIAALARPGSSLLTAAIDSERTQKTHFPTRFLAKWSVLHYRRFSCCKSRKIMTHETVRANTIALRVGRRVAASEPE